jgi:plasmid stability protein
MATLTLKNVPDDVYERLKRRAAANRRSLNQEAIQVLAGAVGRGKEFEQLVAEIDRFQEAVAAEGFHATADEIDAWIEEGRA